MQVKRKYYQDIVSFQLYPNKEQKEFLEKEFEFYHRFKKYLKKYDKAHTAKFGRFKSYKEAHEFFLNIKNNVLRKYTGKIDSHFFLSHLNFAVDACSAPYTAGPGNEFEGKFRYNRQTIRIDYKEGIGLYKRYLYMANNMIRMRPDRETNIKAQYFTIWRENGKYFLDCLVFKTNKKIVETGVFCGIDFGFKNIMTLVDSLGNVVTYKLHNEEIEKSYDKIKVINKHIENEKTKNPYSYFKANNYRRLLDRKTKEARRIKRIRSRFYNEICAEIAMKYDYISIESLNIYEMYDKYEFKSRMRLISFKELKTILSNQITKYGKVLYKCSRYFKSSQICNHCGEVHPEMNERAGKEERIICKCGYEADRDINAARNLLDEMIKNIKVAPTNNVNVFLKMSQKPIKNKPVQLKLF